MNINDLDECVSCYTYAFMLRLYVIAIAVVLCFLFFTCPFFFYGVFTGTSEHTEQGYKLEEGKELPQNTRRGKSLMEVVFQHEDRHL